MRRPILLAASWYREGGYARVTGEILAPLAQRWQVHYLGFDYQGAPHDRRGMRVHPAPRGPWHLADALEDLNAALRPDVLFLVHDLHIVAACAERARRFLHRPFTVGSFPVEGRISDGGWVQSLASLDRLAVPTSFARREVERHLPPAKSGHLAVVPYGIDSRCFRPLTAAGDRQRCRLARSLLFPDRPELQSGFWVLNANALSPRKRLGTTLWGFAEFARDKPPDVRLCLPGLWVGSGEAEELLGLAHRLGLARRLIPRPATGGGELLDDASLNLLYNACEVGVNTSSGEGWGLASFEHAAAGAAQVVPDHSSPGELWRGAAELLAARGSDDVLKGLFETSPVSAGDLGAVLQRLYADPHRLQRTSLAAYERAVGGQAWTWGDVSRRFETFFQEAASHDLHAA